jgi:predicted dehydrogenase
MMLRIGIIGQGGYAGDHWAGLTPVERTGACRIVANAVVDPQNHAARLERLRAEGVEVFGTAIEMFDAMRGRMDAVTIPTSIYTHAELMIAAIERGYDVYLEKPPAATIQEALRMAESEKASGRRVSIGYQWSFSPAIQALKKDILRGDFGRPIRLKTLVLWPRMRSYYGRSPWAGAIRSGDGRWVLDSPVNNATAHYLHNMFYVLGPTRETGARPREVKAELYRANPIENYDTAALRCRADNGAEILFFSTHAVASSHGPAFRYEFEKAVVSYEATSPWRIVAQLRDGGTRDYGDPDAEPANKLWQSVESVRTGSPTACGIEAAMAHTLCMNGAQESVPAVTVFPPDVIKTQDVEADDRLTWVEGLGESLLQCYDRECLPSELGSLSWAREGRAVDLRNYRFFPGGKPG